MPSNKQKIKNMKHSALLYCLFITFFSFFEVLSAQVKTISWETSKMCRIKGVLKKHHHSERLQLTSPHGSSLENPNGIFF